LIALQAIKEQWNKEVIKHFYAPGDLLRENGQPTGCVGLTFIS
jgi:hypothetical protein